MKRKYLLLPLFVLLASCNKTPSESVSVQPSDSVESDDKKINVTDELTLIKNSPSPTSIRDSLLIIKDGTIYLDILDRIEYDEENGIYYTYHQESGLSDLNNPNSSYNTSSTIYYDGYDSYTLDSDEMYIKKEEEKEIVSLKIDFNFDLLESLVGVKEGYRNLLTAKVSSAKANEFLKTSNKEISDIEFKSYSNGEVLQSIELTYTQNGFNVTRTLDYTYTPITLVLPKNTK